MTAGLFPMSFEEILAEIDRELDLRRRKYPEWVAANRMHASAADRQLLRLTEARKALVAHSELIESCRLLVDTWHGEPRDMRDVAEAVRAIHLDIEEHL